MGYISSKNNNDDEKMVGRVYATVAIVLAIIAVIVIAAVTASILAPRERTTKAQKYNLDCVTELKRNPLQECKE